MIGILFSFGTEAVEVRVQGFNVFFRTSQFQRFADIEGIKLDKQGTIKEFPDLKENEDWENIGKQRFKEKIKKMKNEEEISKYILEDLSKFGYVPSYIQKAGFRPVKL